MEVRVVFKEITSAEFIEKTKGNTLESSIYKTIYEELSNTENQKEIVKEFPKPEIHRRNTGYAIDLLLKSELFWRNRKNNKFREIALRKRRNFSFYHRNHVESG